MPLRVGRPNEATPIALNLLKDSSWAYTFGVVSIVAFIPVLSFQVYECWKHRKEGTHKLLINLAGILAISANGVWMVSDVFFHDHFRPIVKWIFNISFIIMGLFFLFSFLNKRKAKKNPSMRIMAISQQTRGLVFVHGSAQGQLSRLHKPSVLMPRSVLVRKKHQHQSKH
jgi:hypothetical protein